MTARPFLKWAGGKRWLAPDLVADMPREIGAYYEPFLGGGAVFWELVRSVAAGERAVREYVLSDANAALVECYRAVRDDAGGVLHYLGQVADDRYTYYSLRDRWPPDGLTPAANAARFIYLNRCGFNGLQRTNKNGQNNVPYGKRKRPWVVDAENLRACSAALQGVSIKAQSFLASGTEPTALDVVYFDPPYLGTFSGYTAAPFGEREHRDLAKYAAQLASRGTRVYVSNSIAAAALYPGALEIEARRSIAASPGARKSAIEILWQGGRMGE